MTSIGKHKVWSYEWVWGCWRYGSMEPWMEPPIRFAFVRDYPEYPQACASTSNLFWPKHFSRKNLPSIFLFFFYLNGPKTVCLVKETFKADGHFIYSTFEKRWRSRQILLISAWHSWQTARWDPAGLASIFSHPSQPCPAFAFNTLASNSLLSKGLSLAFSFR